MKSHLPCLQLKDAQNVKGPSQNHPGALFFILLPMAQTDLIPAEQIEKKWERPPLVGETHPSQGWWSSSSFWVNLTFMVSTAR